MSDINNNFGKFFNAQQKLNAYNDYNKLSSKAKKNNEELRNAADINGDGKINSKDRTAANNEIKELKKDELLFDVNGDGKVDLNDLIMISNGFDIDGDGDVSEKEMKFLQDQEKTLINQLKNNLDLNGDGEVNLNDLENLTNWIEERDSYNSKDQVDTFLQKIQINLNKTLGLTNLKSLAQTQEKLDKTNYFMEGRYDITENDSLDADGNGTIDANDAKLFGLAAKSLQQQLKVNVADINSAKTNYDTTLAEKNELDAQKKEAQTLRDSLKKELDSANKAVTTANRNISSYERSLATAQKNLERAKTDANKAKYQKQVDDYQAKLNAEKEKLQTAQATQAEKQTAYDAAKANYDTLSADLKTKTTENNSAKTAYNKYSNYYKNYGDFEINDVAEPIVPVEPNPGGNLVDPTKPADAIVEVDTGVIDPKSLIDPTQPVDAIVSTGEIDPSSLLDPSKPADAMIDTGKIDPNTLLDPTKPANAKIAQEITISPEKTVEEVKDQIEQESASISQGMASILSSSGANELEIATECKKAVDVAVTQCLNSDMSRADFVNVIVENLKSSFGEEASSKLQNILNGTVDNQNDKLVSLMMDVQITKLLGTIDSTKAHTETKMVPNDVNATTLMVRNDIKAVTIMTRNDINATTIKQWVYNDTGEPVEMPNNSKIFANDLDAIYKRLREDMANNPTNSGLFSIEDEDNINVFELPKEEI